GGIVEDKETIYRAAEKLISQGANAIAIFAVLENPYQEAEEEYLLGTGVDPIGRVEAIISHLLVEKTNLPAAHAPIFLNDYTRTVVDPRVSAEEIGYTYIPCVIRGLQFAPQYVEPKSKDCINIDDVNALICPYSAMNGDWLTPALEKSIKIIAVKNNSTALHDTPEKLNLINKVIVAENYLEVMGILGALKANINYKSLIRPLKGVIKIPEAK
ncbi:MAG: DUF3326 domain-containing protein, partial [Candidatus Sericytochromatia bacterium]|nr:DUF3326 domain-containing protein [Candidatus Sericytochromatia bacterium]